MEHAPTKNKFHLTVLIEFLVSAGLGIYFHWVLHWQKEAYIVLAIGLLLTLATYLLADEIARSRDLVIASYHRSHGLLTTLSLIDDKECQERAHSVLAATDRTLMLLQDVYEPHDKTENKHASAKTMAQSRHQVQAVDPLTVG